MLGVWEGFIYKSFIGNIRWVIWGVEWWESVGGRGSSYRKVGW